MWALLDVALPSALDLVHALHSHAGDAFPLVGDGLLQRLAQGAVVGVLDKFVVDEEPIAHRVRDDELADRYESQHQPHGGKGVKHHGPLPLPISYFFRFQALRIRGLVDVNAVHGHQLVVYPSDRSHRCKAIAQRANKNGGKCRLDERLYHEGGVELVGHDAVNRCGDHTDRLVDVLVQRLKQHAHRDSEHEEAHEQGHHARLDADEQIKGGA
mmetsp:Transcript_22248/g.63836  ORF Transcript_22248/g.63836 Transcript_22248/m.63836 type:complete len:213 (+) Transcript_22248:1118-1756(+)